MEEATVSETTNQESEELEETNQSEPSDLESTDEPKSELIQGVIEKLNEEKWTRSTIGNYSKKHFAQFDELIQQARDQHEIEELLRVCMAHLKQSSSSTPSIMALYIAGVINHEDDVVGENYLYRLLSIFKENRKLNIVELLAEKILEYGEDKIALIMLQECYEYTGNTDDLPDIWERLAKIDFENGDIARKLGDYYDRKGDTKKSTTHYKMALRRFARQQHMQSIEEIWLRLAQLIPEDIEFFYSLEKEITRNTKDFNEQLSSLFLTNAKYAQDQTDIPLAIELYKKILHYNSKDRDTRRNLVDCYRLFYEDHSLLDYYLDISKLEDLNADAEQAIDSFEKHIAFDTGHYVYHRSWGIGKILEMVGDSMQIDFKQRKGHRMSLKMALNSLKPLSDDHIWVVKEKDPESLRDDSEKGIENTLRIFFHSYNNVAMMKEIKAELVPNVIPSDKWTKWWTKAKKVMKTSSEFGYSPAKKDVFFLRDKPLTYEEETFFNFSNVKTYDEKLIIFLDFLKHTDVVNSEPVQEMLSFFINNANKSELIDHRTVQSFIICHRLRKQIQGILTAIEFKPEDLLNLDEEELVDIYDKLYDADFKKDMLNFIRKIHDEWQEVYLHCFYTKVTRAHNFIVDVLFEQNQKRTLKSAFGWIMTNPRQRLETFVWGIRVLFNKKELIDYLDLNYEDLIINLLKILEYLNKEIENKQDIAFHRKIHGQILDILIRDEALLDYLKYELEGNDKSSRFFALINNSPSFIGDDRRAIIQILYAKFPFLEEQSHTEEEDEEDIKGAQIFWVTKRKFEEKQQDLNTILNEEIPRNSKDLGEAQAKGDLRENAEYIAALERQQNLKEMASKLGSELRTARILQPKDIDVSEVGVGTVVEVQNVKGRGKTSETYTILGDWESDPDENIISYRSPLGMALLNAKEGDEVTFSHAKKTKNYKVLSIKAASLE